MVVALIAARKEETTKLLDLCSLLKFKSLEEQVALGLQPILWKLA